MIYNEVYDLGKFTNNVKNRGDSIHIYRPILAQVMYFCSC